MKLLQMSFKGNLCVKEHWKTAETFVFVCHSISKVLQTFSCVFGAWVWVSIFRQLPIGTEYPLLLRKSGLLTYSQNIISINFCHVGSSINWFFACKWRLWWYNYSSFEFIKRTKTDVHMDNFVVKTLTVASTEKKWSYLLVNITAC